MPEQATCGKGLAQNAALPAKLAGVNEAVAENLSARIEREEEMLAAARNR
jgi:hypothetical protein